MPASPYDTDGLPPIRAGLARRRITPPIPCLMAGFFHEREATSVRDDLFCNAAVIESGGGHIVLVNLDLIAIDRGWGDEARALIAQRLDMPPQAVLICATHTHTGPAVRPAVRGEWVNFEWLDALPEVIADTVSEAADGMFDAMLMPGRTSDETSVCRIARLRDGSEHMGASADGRIGPAGVPDHELLALGVRELDGTPRGMVVCYGMHANVIGGGSADFISADWQGEVYRAASGVYGESFVTVLLNAPNGDVYQKKWEPTRLPQSGPAKAVQAGRTLAAAAINCSEKAEPLESGGISWEWEDLSIPYYERTERLREHIDHLRAQDDLPYLDKWWVRRFDEWEHEGEIAEVPVQVLRLGDLTFVGLPSEVFAAWGLEVKRWSPTEWTAVASLSNAWFGYIPTTDQASRWAYGARPTQSLRLIPDAGRRIADAAQRLMARPGTEEAGRARR
jgi:neutral ceramidase